jgi:hypothetical protein
MSPVLASSTDSSSLATAAEETNPVLKDGYGLAIALGWGTTLLAAVGYILLTQRDAVGAYHIQDLIVFTLFNGPLEQLMFIGWFLLGCLVARAMGVRSTWKIFGLGFLTYSIYSGFIHALFWVAVLPTHQVSEFVFIRIGLLTVMSLSWMWLFWRYRAIGTIICMHMVIDFLTIGHLHFHWFDSYQLSRF